MELFTVYVSQNGSSLETLLDKQAANQLYHTIVEEGRPIGVWSSTAAHSVGITLNPRMGGVVLSMSPAEAVACDEEGNTLSEDAAATWQRQGQQIQWLEPERQRRGQVLPLQWTDEATELGAETLVTVQEIQRELAHERDDLGRILQGERAHPEPAQARVPVDGPPMPTPNTPPEAPPQAQE